MIKLLEISMTEDGWLLHVEEGNGDYSYLRNTKDKEYDCVAMLFHMASICDCNKKVRIKEVKGD